MWFNVLLGVLAASQFQSTQLVAEEITTEVSLTTSLQDSTIAELLPTSAEKLVRYRREPPPKIKHYIRLPKRSKPRRRLKRPKIRYGPPSYSYVESISYKKPRPPPPPDQHTFSFDELKNINFDTSQFDFPPSSYEAQAMDLDFYSDDHISYDSPKNPGKPYSIDPEPEIPSSYKYKIESQLEESLPREPHATYGVPKDYKYNTEFKHPTEDSNNYVIDQYPVFEQQLPFESDIHGSGKFRPEWSELPANKFQPVGSYGAPSHHGGTSPSQTSYKEPPIEQFYGTPNDAQYEQKPQIDGYFNVYDKKLTNAAFPNQHNFAEPPSKDTNIEITYSPSYEINIPPTNEVYTKTNNNQHSGHFAEPPSYAPEHVSEPEYPQSQHPEKIPQYPDYQITKHVSGPEYPQKQHPEKVPQYPDYQITKHVSGPEYPQSQHPGKMPQYPDYPVPEHTAISPTISHDVFTPPYSELPLNPHHRQHGYDYPKSSYEVPIYDPIPFESLSNDEQEYYPPHPYDINNIASNNNNNQHQDPGKYKQQNSFAREENFNHQIPQVHASHNENHGDSHSSSTSITILTTKKPRTRNHTRKYGRGTSTIKPIKHILDVPELQAAFEADQRKKLFRLESDTEMNESTNIENNQYYISSTATTPFATENYVNQEWHPMRIRTSTRIIPTKEVAVQSLTTTGFLPTIVPILRQRPKMGLRNKWKSSTSFSPNLLQTSNATDNLGNISIISTEKPQLNNYYDDTISSFILTNSTKLPSSRRKIQSKLIPQIRTKLPIKQTTKSVYETTYFKFPRTEKQTQNTKNLLLEQGLPKNHKLY